jgi:hypothetical protein
MKLDIPGSASFTVPCRTSAAVSSAACSSLALGTAPEATHALRQAPENLPAIIDRKSASQDKPVYRMTQRDTALRDAMLAVGGWMVHWPLP